MKGFATQSNVVYFSFSKGPCCGCVGHGQETGEGWEQGQRGRQEAAAAVWVGGHGG